MGTPLRASVATPSARPQSQRLPLLLLPLLCHPLNIQLDQLALLLLQLALFDLVNVPALWADRRRNMTRVARRALADRWRVFVVTGLLCAFLSALEAPLAHLLGQSVPQTVSNVIEDDCSWFIRSHAEHAADLLQVHAE